MSIYGHKPVRIDSKTHYYYGNGTGRDTYILRFNGGMMSGQMIDTLKPKGKNLYAPLHFENINSPQRRRNPPPMENKLTHYWSDGTGRDTYIKVNDGGRSTSWNAHNHTDQIFHDQLRSYERLPNLVSPQNAGRYTLNWKTEKQIEQEKRLYFSQKVQALRLSQPRLVRKATLPNFTPTISNGSKRLKTDFQAPRR